MINDCLPIKVVLAVNIRIYCDGIRAFLEQLDHIEVLEAVDSIPALIATWQRQPADLLIVDSGLPHLTKFLLLLSEIAPAMKFILLATQTDGAGQQELASNAGCCGTVSAQEPLLNLAVRITQAFDNRNESHQRFSASPQSQPLLASQPLIDGCFPQKVLTKRQIRVLALIESGCSNKEISRTLKIETCTVKNHVHNILQRLQVNSRCEAAAIYRRTSSPFAYQLHQARQAGPVNVDF